MATQVSTAAPAQNAFYPMDPCSSFRSQIEIFLREDLKSEIGHWLPHIHPTLLWQDLLQARGAKAEDHIFQIAHSLSST